MKRVVGFRGDLVFGASKLDGAPRKLMDVSRLRALGWGSSIELGTGLEKPINGTSQKLKVMK